MSMRFYISLLTIIGSITFGLYMYIVGFQVSIAMKIEIMDKLWIGILLFLLVFAVMILRGGGD